MWECFLRFQDVLDVFTWHPYVTAFSMRTVHCVRCQDWSPSCKAIPTRKHCLDSLWEVLWCPRTGVRLRRALDILLVSGLSVRILNFEYQLLRIGLMWYEVLDYLHVWCQLLFRLFLQFFQQTFVDDTVMRLSCGQCHCCSCSTLRHWLVVLVCLEGFGLTSSSTCPTRLLLS